MAGRNNIIVLNQRKVAEYVKSAGLAGHVRRKFEMSGEGVNSRRREEIEQIVCLNVKNVRRRISFLPDITPKFN